MEHDIKVFYLKMACISIKYVVYIKNYSLLEKKNGKFEKFPGEYANDIQIETKV